MDKNLVLVEWEDSVLGYQGWKVIKEQQVERTTFYSVGFLIHRDKKCTVLYPHLEKKTYKNRSGAGDIIIPSSAILKITHLKKKKK